MYTSNLEHVVEKPSASRDASFVASIYAPIIRGLSHLLMRADVEDPRGVDCDTLLKRRMWKVKFRKLRDASGRADARSQR